MRWTSAMTVAFGVLVAAMTLSAQSPAPPPAGNELIEQLSANGHVGRVRRYERLGGLLNYHIRAV